MNTDREIIPTNRITRRKIFLLAFVVLVGGLLLPMGVIRAAAEMRQAVYPPATGADSDIQNTGNNNSSKTNDKGRGGLTQAATGTVDLAVPAVSNADLSITKTHDLDFDIGSSDRNIFNIEITNDSLTETYTGEITFVDEFPEGELTPTNIIINDSRLKSCNTNENTVTCYYTTTLLLPGDSLSKIEIKVNVGTEALPNSTNKVRLLVDDSDDGNNSDTDTVDIRYTDFEISKTVNIEFPKEQDTIDYLIEVKNNGPYSSTKVEVVDHLPIGLTYIMSKTSKGTYFPSTGRWKIDNLPVLNTEKLTITAKVDTGTTEETITNTAIIDKTDVYDSNPANNSDSAKITVEGTDLHVKKTDKYKYVYPGQIFTYTLTISNTGGLTATGVTITDVLGSDYTYISNTDSLKLTEDLTNTYVSTETYTIPPNDKKEFTMKVKVNDPVDSPIDLTNIISATSKEEPTVTENNSDEDINILADFDLEKIVSPTSANTGGTLRFTINVKNTGQSELKNIVIRDTYPNVLNIVRTIPDDAVINNNNGTISYTVKSLAINETSSLVIDTVVNDLARGTFTRKNNAIVDAKTPDGDPLPQQTASVSFNIVGTVLPPTGGLEGDQGPGSLFWVVSAIGLLLGALGLGALVYSLWAKSGNPTWARWFTTTGLILVSACLIFVFGSFLFRNRGGSTEQISSLESTEPAIADTPTASQVESPLPTVEIIQFQEPYVLDPSEPVPETLPDYPVPTPTIVETAQEDDGLPDTSSVERIVIPALALDTVVKYVPFSEFTWLIAGLRQEIAWMGDTSWPGLGGNTGLAGHVTLGDGSDGPFRHLEELEAGDEIKLYTGKNEYTYRVSEKTVVKDTNFSVVEKTENSQITLITCTGWNQAARMYLERLIVYADLVDTSPL